MTDSQIIFNVRTWQDTDGKWRASVVDGADEPIVITPARSSAEKATGMARRVLMDVMNCNHKMRWSEWGMIGQDVMGNNLDGHSGECEKCGYLDTIECEYPAFDVEELD